MGNFKQFWVTVVAWFICVLLSKNGIKASFSKSLPNIKNSNSSSLCFLNVIPLQYEIDTGPIDNSSDYVSCWVKIKAKIGENICNFWNQNNNGTFFRLNSRNCKLDLESLTVSKVVTDEQAELLTLKAKYDENLVNASNVPSYYVLELEKSEINIGDQILLNVKYEIQLQRKKPEEPWQGLYFFDSKNIKKSDLGHHSPLHAKYIFPIFDYSDSFHKPTFKISVTRYIPNKFVSISNTDIVETVENLELGQDWVIDIFRESPPMKLDQVTLLILGGYQNDSLCTESVQVNLWTMKYDSKIITNDTIDHTLFEIGRMVDYAQEIFNATKYPLNKIDFVVLPWHSYEENLQRGNLGIVISMDHKLLSNSDGYLGEFKTNSETYEFIARQIALQWFRGLTSPINKYDDEAMSGEAVVNYVINWLLNYSTKPWPPYVALIYEMDIARFLTMMESVFSREIIQYAINQLYLPKLVNKGTFPGNLWQSIEQSIVLHNKTNALPINEENGTVPLAEIFNSWINNTDNFPTIVISEVRNETDSIELYQEYRQTVDVTNHNLWWVPLNISNGNEHFLISVSPNETSLNSSKIYKNSELIDTLNGLIFVNENLTKHFDVEYSEQLLKNLVKHLDIEYDLIPKDVIQKHFVLEWQHSNWATIEKTLNLTEHLNKEMDARVWQRTIRTLGGFECTFLNQPNNFQAYFGGKINQVLEKVGLYPKLKENKNIAELRTLLMQYSHLYEVPLFIQLGTNLLVEWMENTTVNPFYENFEPEIRGALYCAAISNLPNNLAFNFLYEKLVNSDLPDGDMEFKREYDNTWMETKQLCKALTCKRDDDLLKSLFRNDTKLATLEHEFLRICYRQIIPYGILWRRPLTMRKSVYDFWKTFNVQNYRHSDYQTEETQIVMEWTNHKPVLSEHIQNTFVEDYFKLSPRDLYTPGFWLTRDRSLTLMPRNNDKKFDEICEKSEDWFAREVLFHYFEKDCFY